MYSNHLALLLRLRRKEEMDGPEGAEEDGEGMDERLTDRIKREG